MNLPTGWSLATLGDIAKQVRNGLFASRPTDDRSGTAILRISAVRDGVVRIYDRRFVHGLDADQINKYALREGDLLFTRYNGSRHLVGACARVPSLSSTVIHPDKLIRVVVDESVADSRFVAHQMAGPAARLFLEPRIRTTAGQSGISGKDVRAMPLVLPPLNEQLRIVEVIEYYLSHLSSAAGLLRNARGRLIGLEASSLSEAREGELVALKDVAAIQGGIQKQPKRTPRANAYPFLRVANVTSIGLDLNDLHSVELFGTELDRLRLEVGDLLVVEGNGSASQIGRAALWDGSISDCVHQNHLIRVRPSAVLLPEYLEAVWNSPESRQQLTDLASSTSGLFTLSVAKLSSLRIPVPSVAYQARVVERTRDTRAAIRRLQAEIDATTSMGNGLRGSLVPAVFSGRFSCNSASPMVVEELASV